MNIIEKEKARQEEYLKGCKINFGDYWNQDTCGEQLGDGSINHCNWCIGRQISHKQITVIVF